MATSSATPYASASLYVGDLSPDVTEALLFEIFNAVGPVASVRVCRDATTRRSLGYAYVNFHRVEDAERALDTMNFKNIRNRPCRIMWSHRDPSLRKSGVGNIFVKNLAKSIDNKTLYDTFSMFGNILSCKVATTAKGESRGYGFVHYESEEAAQSAIRRVDGKVIANETVSVSAFKPKTERGGGKLNFTNIYIKNLPKDMSKAAFEELFSKYGAITSSKMENGYAFVNYASHESAARAIQALDGKIDGDKKLYVARHQKKEERERLLRERFEQKKLERQNQSVGVNVYIKNLSDDIDDKRLQYEFHNFGSTTSVKVMRDSTGQSRGFGFVCYTSPEEASRAIQEMNGRMLGSKPITVCLAQRKDVRRAQLEAARSKIGVGPPQLMPHQGFLYQSPRMVYPQPMIPARRWAGQTSPMIPAVRGVPAGVPYLMPVSAPTGASTAGRVAAGGRGGRGGMAPTRGRGGPAKLQDGGRGGGRPYPMHPQTGSPAAASLKGLASAPDDQKKQIIGESLFPLVKEKLLKIKQAELTGKITGMLLEMDNGELLLLLENREALSEKIDEALNVLRNSVEDDEEEEES